MQKQFISALSFLFFFSQILFAQNGDYSRVKVFLDEKNTIEKLARLGVEADHGHIDLQRSIINDFSKFEIWYRDEKRHIMQPISLHQLQNHFYDMTKVHLNHQTFE